jgi:hypothetical protein
MRHIPLEVPLRAFPLSRLLQGDDAGAARVQVLHEPLDRAALACGVAALEHDHVPGADALAPLLQLEQFDLQQPLFVLVLGPGHAGVVGVVLPPGVDFVARRMDQHRIVVVIVAHGVSVDSQSHRQKLSAHAYAKVTCG